MPLSRAALALLAALCAFVPGAARADEPPPPSGDAPTEVAAPEPGAPPRSAFLLELYLGPSYRYLAHEHFLSGAGGGVIGWRSPRYRFGIGMRLEGHYGATVHGLTFSSFAFGPTAEVRLAPGLHLELTAPHLTFVSVHRVTAATQDLVGLAAGVSATIVFDVWGEPYGHDVFLALRGSLDYGEDSGSASVLLSLGYRIPGPQPAGR